MGSGIGPKGLVLCSGCGLSLLGRTLSASRRPTVCHLLSVLRGFSLLVFLLLSLLGRLIRVVVLFCFVLRCLWSTLGVMFPVVTCRLNSLSSVALFGFVVCTHLIANLRGTNSLEISTPRSIPRSPQFSVVTLMRSLIAPLIGLALIPPSPLAIALPPLHIFLTTAVWWTYGGISTPLLLGLPGPGGMAVLPLVLTFLVFLFRGCPLSLLVLLSPVNFLITVVSFFLVPSRTPFPLVQASEVEHLRP